jgi:hypothetical protein
MTTLRGHGLGHARAESIGVSFIDTPNVLSVLSLANARAAKALLAEKPFGAFAIDFIKKKPFAKAFAPINIIGTVGTRGGMKCCTIQRLMY